MADPCAPAAPARESFTIPELRALTPPPAADLTLSSGQPFTGIQGATYGLHVGEKVTVWYDPASPSDSALKNYPPTDLAVVKYATFIAAAVSAVALTFVVVGLF